MSVGTRIERAMIHRGHNNNSLSKLIGIHASTVKNWITNTTTPDTLKLDILCEKLDISKDWLLTGEGEMLKNEKKFISEVSPRDESDYMMVEYVDLRASAGRLGVGNVEILPDTHRRLVPKEYATGKFLVVRVDGDSMDDGSKRSLSDGDEILIYLNEDGINGGLAIRKTVFVITTQDGNILKQITRINKEEGYIVCHSFNSAYPDFKINFEDIFQIFTVCKVVNRQISLI